MPDPPDAAMADAAPPGPRRVIFMIGDGMGPGQLDTASLKATGARVQRVLQSLARHGLIRTASRSGTTDSAASATTMAAGVRAWNGDIAVDRDGQTVETVVELAHRLGLAGGVVATSILPHA